MLPPTSADILLPNLSQKYVTLESVPKTCNTCSKKYTKSADESTGGEIFFCSNKNCTTRGFGFHQTATGFITQGTFKHALDNLERYRY